MALVMRVTPQAISAFVRAAEVSSKSPLSGWVGRKEKTLISRIAFGEKKTIRSTAALPVGGKEFIATLLDRWFDMSREEQYRSKGIARGS